MPIHPHKAHKAKFTFNDKIVVILAGVLGSPWTIYVFVLLALVSLPQVVATGNIVLIDAWVAQTFIQLVALAILQAKAVQDGGHSEEQSNAIYDNAVKAEKHSEKVLTEIEKLASKMDRLATYERKLIKAAKVTTKPTK